MISEFRHWLIRLLARGDSIVLNTHFELGKKDGMVHFKKGKGALVIYHCLFDSRADLNE